MSFWVGVYLAGGYKFRGILSVLSKRVRGILKWSFRGILGWGILNFFGEGYKLW